MNCSLDEDFIGLDIDFPASSNSVCIRPAIIIRDLDSFCQKMIDTRNQDLFRVKLKIFADRGGDFFKLGIGTIDVKQYFNHEDNKRARYSNGIAPKVLKDTSVDKTLIIGIVPNLEENYSNCSELWKMINFSKVKFKLCSDLKLWNIMIGLSSHSSKCPCCFCNQRTDDENWLFKAGTKHTLGSIRAKSEAWRRNGGKKQDIQIYDNTINHPLIDGDDSVSVLDVCNVPELHLYTELVNLLWNKLASLWGEENWEPFPRAHSLIQVKIHGGEFEGNQCRQLLRLTDVLRDVLPEELKMFCDAFD